MKAPNYLMLLRLLVTFALITFYPSLVQAQNSKQEAQLPSKNPAASLASEIYQSAGPFLYIEKELIEIAKRRADFDVEGAEELFTFDDHVSEAFQLTDHTKDILFMYSYMNETCSERKGARNYVLIQMKDLIERLARTQQKLANDIKTVKIDRVKELMLKAHNQIEQIFALIRKVNDIP